MATEMLHSLSGPVTADLNFCLPTEDGSKPLGLFAPELDSRSVTISDLRGKELKFSLESNAFQVLQCIKSDLELKDFDDDEYVKRCYFPEVEKLIFDHVPGASRVFLYNHVIRRPRQGFRRPVKLAHLDQTERSATELVYAHLPEQADKLLQGRYRIINVWRPINGPIYAEPLALADSATVIDDDLVTFKTVYPDRSGETLIVKYNQRQEWYYLSGMTNDERLLIKCFDSDKVGIADRGAPHTAFSDPRTPVEAPDRESVEVRALVFG